MLMKMTKRNRLKEATLVASLILFSSVATSRPMSEMSGGCENYAMPLSKELSLWDQSEIRVQGARDVKSTASLPAGQRVNLSLHMQKKVSLPAKPEKDFSKGEPTFAALATMEVKRDGLYRVSLGSKVWLDLVESGSEVPQIVPAAHFEMQTGCRKIFKVVEYNLKAGRKYLLQISSSREPAAQVLTSFVN
jgi:hypothetical protein